MESEWAVEGPENLFFPLRISENSNLPSYSAGPETCRLGAGCELLQGGGSYSQGLGASGKVSEGGDQAITVVGNEGEMAGEDGLARGKAQHQTVLESSRNSEQRDPEEKGPKGRPVRGTQTLWSIFCKTVTQPDF